MLALRKLFTKSHSYLSREQLNFWSNNGYLILPNALSEKEVMMINELIDNLWKNRENLEDRFEIDVLSGPRTGSKERFNKANDDSRNEVYKLNNLFTTVSEIRRIALKPEIKMAIADILDGEPLICNSLNFERGSQQPYHLDTWYMPPPVDNKMVAANIALDRVDNDNGPFTYYPGSNRIPLYRFSDGRLNVIQPELSGCVEHINKNIKKMGLQPKVFNCNPGDVFLWHANLYHGGSPINDMKRTRKSLVVHYWRKEDMDQKEVRQDEYGAYLGRTLRGEQPAF